MDTYIRSFDELEVEFDEDNRLRSIREQYFNNLVEVLTRRQKEWDEAFRELLKKSQECDDLPPTRFTIFPKPSLSFAAPTKTPQQQLPLQAKEADQQSAPQTPKITQEKPKCQVESKICDNDEDFKDPLFSNMNSVKKFLQLRENFERNRNSFSELNTNPNLKAYKNELNLFIRTQINSISNSNSQHLESKTRSLTSLFNGQKVRFQERLVDATLHPQAQAFAMDLAAQTFVLVGTRLVNSVPAIAKSMATVINGIAKNELAHFKDLVVCHIQERCPYLIPMHPKAERGQEAANKIACGYSYDFKTQTLESEDKYLARMRSMVLIYACMLMQEHIGESWTWLASFLSLRPQPVISATILQAFLQESSKKLSSTYGRQYSKLLKFIRECYVKMIEDATPKATDRQSLVKLKNLLADDSKLIAAPSATSIFGAIRF